jgi:ABC-type multidrug transport system fused ATPase/permease subunit
MTGMYYMIVSTFLVNTFVQSMLLLVGAKLIEHGKLTTEVLLAFMLYQGQLQNEMMNLFQSYSSLIKSSGAGDRVFELLDRIPPEPGTGSRSVQLAERRTRNPTTDRSVSLELKNLHFEYPSRRDHSVLNGINLTVSAGQTIAIVGPSGSGKSTIVGLLQRFYDPSRGSILVDGVDLQAISLKEYRQRVGVVNQDNTLFAGSILSNIIYGIAHATKEQAIEAAKLANAHTFISSFPNGYETECGERGVQLSGGQKQRIAIARAIVREPSLLLLDEATSALDTESEEVVQRALDSLLKTNMGITTIIIAHRLRTVRNADLIAVVHDGRVVETGIHEELLQMDGGYYKEMVEKSHGDQLSLD